QLIDHALADVRPHHFAQFETEPADNMLLLNWGLAVPEQARMSVILPERRATFANFCPVDAFLIRLKPAAFRAWRCFARPVIVDRVRFVVRGIGVDILTMHPVTLEIMVRAGWAVNRDFVEVRATKTA